MEKIKGIQQLVYDIIQAYDENDQKTISKREIKSEVMKTDLNVLELQKYHNDRVSKLDRSLDQALFHLNKSRKIKPKGHGFWSLVKVKKDNKYKPRPCRALIPEYLSECPRCGYREKKVSKRPVNEYRCPKCKQMMSVSLFEFYCPVKKSFIGSPTAQCELLHGTDYAEMKKRVDPMKVCYFANKPTSLGLQYAHRKIELFEERQKAMIAPKNRGF